MSESGRASGLSRGGASGHAEPYAAREQRLYALQLKVTHPNSKRWKMRSLSTSISGVTGVPR